MLVGEVLKQLPRRRPLGNAGRDENNPEAKNLYEKLGFAVYKTPGEDEKVLLPAGLW